MTITRKELVKTAKEFNELMDLGPAIATGKEVTEEELLAKISEAAEMLEEDDEISDTAQAVLDYIAEEKEEAADVDGAATEQEEETTEDLVAAADYKGLKAIAAEYPEFKGIDLNLFPVKKVEELRARMLRDLAKKAAKKAPAAEVKEEKPAAKKDVVKVAGKAVPKVGFTNTVDAIVEKGGTWEKMVEAINLEAAKAQAKPWAIGQLKAHVRFRTKKNEAFFGKLNMTEKGMF